MEVVRVDRDDSQQDAITAGAEKLAKDGSIHVWHDLTNASIGLRSHCRRYEFGKDGQLHRARIASSNEPSKHCQRSCIRHSLTGRIVCDF